MVGKGLCNILCCLVPLLDYETVTLIVCDKTSLELSVDCGDALFGLCNKCIFCIGDAHIGNRNGSGTESRILKSEGLYLIEHFCRSGKTVLLDTSLYDSRKLFLAAGVCDFKIKHLLGICAVDKAYILWNSLVEDDSAHCCGDDLALHFAVDFLCHADFNGSVNADKSLVVGEKSLVCACEYFACSLFGVTVYCEVVRAENEVLVRNCDRASVLRL